MALMPTLSKHILEQMDVESITQELQSISKSSRSQRQPQIPVEPPPESESSLTSSVEILQIPDPETQSSSSNAPSDTPPMLVEPLLESESSLTSSVEMVQRQDSEAQTSSSNAPSDTPSDASSTTRSKAELWREVKIVRPSPLVLLRIHIFSAFTRTLTILYSTTLLSLFTSIQLSILGRHKYVLSIQAQEREERMRESCSGELGNSTEEEGEFKEKPISEEMEMVYLTLSWWILHVGWKDVGERVRREVEEVFDGYVFMLHCSRNLH
jgi:peroxin-3